MIRVQIIYNGCSKIPIKFGGINEKKCVQLKIIWIICIYFQNTDLNRSKDDAMATVPPVDQLEGDVITLQKPTEDPFLE